MKKTILILCLFFPTLSIAKVVPNDHRGLVSHWTFDDGEDATATDATGGNDGYLINGTTWISGKYGSAVSFDGVDDFINFAVRNPENLRFQDTDFSVTMWIKTTAAGNNYPSLLCHGYNDTWGWGFFFYPSPYLALACQFVGYGKDDNVHVPNDGTWQFVAVTAVLDLNAETYTVAFYLNGTLTHSYNDITIYQTQDADCDLTFGAILFYHSAIYSAYDGCIDDAAAFNVALTDNEISALYSDVQPINTIPRRRILKFY